MTTANLSQGASGLVLLKGYGRVSSSNVDGKLQQAAGDAVGRGEKEGGGLTRA